MWRRCGFCLCTSSNAGGWWPTCPIRHFDFMANRQRQQRLAICRTLLSALPQPTLDNASTEACPSTRFLVLSELRRNHGHPGAPDCPAGIRAPTAESGGCLNQLNSFPVPAISQTCVSMRFPVCQKQNKSHRLCQKTDPFRPAAPTATKGHPSAFAAVTLFDVEISIEIP